MDYRVKFKRWYQKRFLLTFKKIKNISEIDLSKQFKVSRRTLRGWISEEKTLPKSILTLILKENPKLKKYNRYITHILDPNWGKIIGGKVRYRQLVNEGNFQKHHKLMIKNKMKNITSQRIFLHKKSDYFLFLKKEKIPLKPLLQTMLFTDGYLNEHKHIISFTSKSLELIAIFNDIVFGLYKIKPRILLRKSGIYESYLYNKAITKSLLKLSPTYKTGLDCKPSLKFLFKQNGRTIIECLRLAMTTDGCVIFGQGTRNPFRINSKLIFCCPHPAFLKEWQKLFNNIDFNMNVLLGVNRKSIGLTISKSFYLKKFYGFGGFIDKVKISGKSPRFEGYNKNDILKIALNTSIFKSWDEVMGSLHTSALGS